MTSRSELPETQAIAKQLQEMLKADQDVRNPDKSGIYNGEAIRKADTENTAKLKVLVKKYGWITISAFGQEASTAAWFIIQHADLDPEFQKYCLSLMEKLPVNEVSQHDIAYLTDRILAGENKPLYYGTQFDDFGEYLVIKPVEDSEHLNERRLAMGLDTIEEHIAIMEEAFKQKVYLTPPGQ